MEEQKTEVVEKRLSRGVIRRRARPAAAEAKVAPKADVATEAKAVKKTAELKEVKTPAETKAAGSNLTLSEQQKKAADKNLQSNLKVAKPEEPAQESAAPEVKEVTKTIIRTKEPEKPAKEERKKVLSFKDRIRGTIALDKIKKPEKTEEAKADGEERKARFTKPDATPATTDAAKRAKQKKGVKNIGGDLDVEGRGRASHLSDLVKTTTMDRVFRPGGGIGRSKKKKIVSRKNIKQTAITTKKASKRVVEIDQNITVTQLAQQLGAKAGDVIKQLMDLGVMATINQEIDKDTAALIAAEYQHEIKDTSFKEDQVLGIDQKESEEEATDAPTRPPVVTVMGHVDHGKTSLLDAIRTTNVTAGEAGGITQHIGAYTVELPQGNITFLDTPGHEAFTTMRSRGAQVTDIVILVVAADDGIMPQTSESIDHAKAAGVPIIVAVNKIDKEDADPERVKRQLSEKGLLPEDWGGDTMFFDVSAIQKTGIDSLLEGILLQAEVLELKADPEKRAKGIVLEAKLDRNRGPVCTLLIQTGTIKASDYVVAGEFYGKIRAMHDWKGNSVKEAGPSTAVEVLGFGGVPDAGDSFNDVATEQDARKVVEFRQDEKAKEGEASKAVSLEDMFSRMKTGEMQKFNIILKADTQGSLEAVNGSIAKLGNDEVTTEIIRSGVGGINESDVRLALASQAVIIGFNIRPETKAIHLAKEQSVDVKLYKVIYDLIEEVKLAMQGMLTPDVVEEYLGRAEVRDTFAVSKFGTIAGCMVVDGNILRNCSLRLLRDSVVIHEGLVSSLKRFKDDAKEVKQGFECGIGIEGYNDIKTGDVIEAFQTKEIQKTL